MHGVLLTQLPVITSLCLTLCCVRGVQLPPLPVVTCGYYVLPAVTSVLHGSMLCTRSTVTSVTWWLPGGYLWLPLVTSVTRYCLTPCCVRGVWLPLLPGGYLWLPALPGIA